MINPGHFIRCGNCGYEFPSLFAGAGAVVGCVESCPKCGNTVNSPMLMGEFNIDQMNQAAQQPMIREYGPEGADGNVFAGSGMLDWSYRQPAIVWVNAAYRRNFSRVFDLLDVHYEVSIERRQTLINAILIMTMAAYETMTDDLRESLNETLGQGTIEKTKRWDLAARRDALFNYIGVRDDIMFRKHEHAMRYAYAFRNCLVHSGGLIDTKLKATIAELGDVPSLTDLPEGNPLNIEISAVVSFANSLQLIAQPVFKRAEAITEMVLK